MPFFMLGGTFIQSLGFYFFAIFIPWYLCKNNLREANELAPHFLKIGLGFILIFIIFPLANFVALLVEQEQFLSVSTLASSLPFRKLMDSHFSSAIFSTGAFFVLLAVFLKYTWIKQKQAVIDHSNLFISFTKGTFIASCMLGCYLLLQHYTGFDFKGAGYKLGSSKRLVTSDSYRTLGFFSHPLSLAGGSLAIFSFYWVLFCQTLTKKNHSEPIVNNPYLSAKLGKYYLLIASLHFGFIILSGGRFAILLGICLCISYPFFLPLSKTFSLARQMFTAIAVGVTGILTFHSGVLYRFQELIVYWQQGKLDRLKFWQVHWQMLLDRPLIGHGHVWLKLHKREAYYKHLGFESLTNKYNAHNLYLEILSNTGILGMIGVLGGGFIIVNSYRHISLKTEHKVLFNALLIAFSANLVNGMTNNSLFDSNIVYVYLFMTWVLTWNLLLTSSKKLSYRNSPSDKYR